MGDINPEPIKTCEIGDRKYSLHRQICVECGEATYCIARFAGMHPSFFRLDRDFDPEEFENTCHNFDDDLFVSAPELFFDFHCDLKKVNDVHGISIDQTFCSRLLEYGRIRAIRLQRLDAFKDLISTDEPLSSSSSAIQSAFELGFAAGQYATEKHSEELFWEGVLAQEAREEGQLRARAALLKKGQQTRKVVCRAAEAVYTADRDLMRNDSATARAIQRLDWPELRPNGKMLSVDAITKHLREERKCRSKNLHENPNLGKSSR